MYHSVRDCVAVPVEIHQRLSGLQTFNYARIPLLMIHRVSNWALFINLKLNKMEDLFKTLGEISKPEPNHFIDYDEDFDDDDHDNDDSDDWEELRQ